MTSPTSETLLRFPLHDRYVALGAKIGAFGDWEVPLYFSSILEEHKAVREDVGFFDISHMGEFFFSGKGALADLEKLLPRPISPMKIGQALYMPLLNEQAGIIDDVILYRYAEEKFLLIVNAGNVHVDLAWIKQHLSSETHFENATEDYALVALQGPKSEALIDALYGQDYSSLAYYTFKEYGDGMIARTGYTGEDGFELLVKKSEIENVFQKICKVGRDYELRMTGFGARDTLRLEAGMLLHGHDMNEKRNPIEAGIGWAVSKEKTGYLGASEIKKIRSCPTKEKMIGFEMIDRGIAREGCIVEVNGKAIGKVTSGSFSPTLKKNIGLAYVDRLAVEAHGEIDICIRDHKIKAQIKPLPFYKRKK
jgi:aminomethyltransferase